MLELFGLSMHFIPRVPEGVGKVKFKQAMMSDDFECRSFAAFGQEYSAIRDMLDQIHVRQALDHIRDGRTLDLQPFSNRLRRHLLIL